MRKRNPTVSRILDAIDADLRMRHIMTWAYKKPRMMTMKVCRKKAQSFYDKISKKDS